MRKFSTVVAIAAAVSMTLPPAPVFAQARVIPASIAPNQAEPVSASVFASTVKAFPKGGEPLKMAISDLVVRHPGFGTDFAMYVQTQKLSAAQEKAVIEGLSDALKRRGVIAQVPPGGIPLWLLVILLGSLAAAVAWLASRDNNNTSTGTVSNN